MIADDVVERVFSEYLERGQADLREYDTLAVSVADLVSLSWTLSGRQSEVPDGSVIECEYEQCLVNEASGVAVSLTERGYAESVPATHSVGKKVFLSPPWTRISVLNALKSVLGELYSWGAYRRVLDGTMTIPAVGTVTLPATCREVLDVLVESLPGTGAAAEWVYLTKGDEYQMLTQFSPPKLRLLSGIPGRAFQASYKADYDLTSFLSSTDLSTLGVSSQLQENLPMAVAGHLLRGAEVPRLQAEELKRVLSEVGAQVAVGSNLNVGQALIDSFRRIYVADEITRLNDLDSPRIEKVGVR